MASAADQKQLVEDNHDLSRIDEPVKAQVDAQNSGCGSSRDGNAPDEESHSLKVFNMATETCIDKCLNMRNKHFGKCYKPIGKDEKEMLEDTVQKVLSRTKVKLMEEVGLFMEMDDMARPLKQVDILLDESKKADKDKLAWRPSGNPEEDANAHIKSVQLQILEDCRRQLEVSEEEENKLRMQVLEKRKYLIETKSKISSLLEKGKVVGDSFAKFKLENDEKVLFCLQKIDSQLLEKSSQNVESQMDL